ncbi:MAG: SDR family NAD(P)-dependent oxidoreductase [Pseudomonadales bacterium]|nr:SDR family NAD(P)-dependent oxidoreductase [Pseudomonadales bacterium]
MAIKKIVFIGANSAVAKTLALQFAEQEVEIFCLARNEASLEKHIKALGGAYKGGYFFDFCDYSQAKAAIQAAVSVLGHIDLAVFAHGTLPDQVVSEFDMAVTLDCFENNLLSVIALLMPVKQQMLLQKTGKIAVISSVAGIRGRPRNFTYGAAKGALSLYLQGLRSVLWDTGVEVYDFKMGPVDSPMTIDHEKNFSFASCDQVSARIIKLLKTRQYQAFVPGYWRWVMLAVRIMPERLFQRLGFLSDR